MVLVPVDFSLGGNSQGEVQAPTSPTLMYEVAVTMHPDSEPSSSFFFVGPNLFHMFNDSFFDRIASFHERESVEDGEETAHLREMPRG